MRRRWSYASGPALPSAYAGDFDLVRVFALGVGGVGVLSLLLAAAGLYAVIAYVVSLRQREFGIRMAIGARPADLRRLVGRAALRLSAWGLGIGLVIAIPLAFVFRALIVGVSLKLLDPLVWIPVIGMLAAVAFVPPSCRRDARRASILSRCCGPIDRKDRIRTLWRFPIVLSPSSGRFCLRAADRRGRGVGGRSRLREVTLALRRGIRARLAESNPKSLPSSGRGSTWRVARDILIWNDPVK